MCYSYHKLVLYLEMSNVHQKRVCHIKRESLENLVRGILPQVQLEKSYAISVSRHLLQMMSLPSMNYCAKQRLPQLLQFIHLHVIYAKNHSVNSWSKSLLWFLCLCLWMHFCSDQKIYQTIDPLGKSTLRPVYNQ